MAPPQKTARFLRGKAFTVSLISTGIIIFMLGCYTFQPKLLKLMDLKVYDVLLHTRKNTTPMTGVPVIVDIDEASLDAYGQWPWPRFLLAQLLDRLSAGGTLAVGLDILLAEQDRSSPSKIQQDLKRIRDVEVRFDGLPADLHDYDQLLAKSLGMATVLGMYCDFTKITPENAVPDEAQKGETQTREAQKGEAQTGEAQTEETARGKASTEEAATGDAPTEDAPAGDVADASGKTVDSGAPGTPDAPATSDDSTAPGAPGAPGDSSGAKAPDASATSDVPANPAPTAATEAPGSETLSPPPPALPKSIGYRVRKTANARDYDELFHRASGGSLPLAEFWQTAPTGMININRDPDGVNRQLPVVGFYQDRLYATLGLRTLMAVFGLKDLVFNTGPYGLESILLGKALIPVEKDGSMLVPFRGPARTFPYYSAKDVLDGTVGPNELKGRIAFIGTSARGLFDVLATPLDSSFPGVETHANVVETILTQTFLRTPPWVPGTQVIAIILTGLVAALAFGFARARVYIPLGLVLLGGAVYGSWFFFQQGLVFSPLYVCLTIGLLGFALLALRFWQEERQKSQLRGAFSRYVAPEVVERIVKMEGNIFAGEEFELSIMFTDIRGFTSISEKLSPQQIVSLLNRYFTPMTALVRGNKGTLDKFIGDALMAFWNAPVPVPGHPALAVLTALQMQEKLAEINVSLHEEFGVSIRMGVGVHTGKAYVGNMGSEELLNYTLIGDNVNLASRLEGLCSQFGVEIVVSAQTKEQCGSDIVFLPLDTLRVKGKAQPVSVFTVMRPKVWQERKMECERYLEAYAAYAAGDFSAALQDFSRLVSDFPENKMYALYTERCQTLQAEPPQDWDGVWTLTSK